MKLELVRRINLCRFKNLLRDIYKKERKKEKDGAKDPDIYSVG
jgi:hypothetical protein